MRPLALKWPICATRRPTHVHALLSGRLNDVGRPGMRTDCEGDRSMKHAHRLLLTSFLQTLSVLRSHRYVCDGLCRGMTCPPVRLSTDSEQAASLASLCDLEEVDISRGWRARRIKGDLLVTTTQSAHGFQNLRPLLTIF